MNFSASDEYRGDGRVVQHSVIMQHIGKLTFRPGDEVLDVGCGSGEETKMIASVVKGVTGTRSRRSYKKAIFAGSIFLIFNRSKKHSGPTATEMMGPETNLKVNVFTETFIWRIPTFSSLCEKLRPNLFLSLF